MNAFGSDVLSGDWWRSCSTSSFMNASLPNTSLDAFLVSCDCAVGATLRGLTVAMCAPSGEHVDESPEGDRRRGRGRVVGVDGGKLFVLEGAVRGATGGRVGVSPVGALAGPVAPRARMGGPAP